MFLIGSRLKDSAVKNKGFKFISALALSSLIVTHNVDAAETKALYLARSGAGAQSLDSIAAFGSNSAQGASVSSKNETDPLESSLDELLQMVSEGQQDASDKSTNKEVSIDKSQSASDSKAKDTTKVAADKSQDAAKTKSEEESKPYRPRNADRKAVDLAIAQEHNAQRYIPFDKPHQENFAQAFVLKKEFQKPEVIEALQAMNGVWRWHRNNHFTYIYFTREFQLIFDDEYRLWGHNYHPADFVSQQQLEKLSVSERRAFEEVNRKYTKKPELYFVDSFDPKTKTIGFKGEHYDTAKVEQFTLTLEPDQDNVGFYKLVRVEKDGRRSFTFARSLLPQEESRFKTIAYYLMYN